jgi:methylthioribose-1-phosphate isomerase
MLHGQVDLVFVGTDRTTRTGDVANKIGTYQKAACAADNHVPFYVFAPSSSIDWAMRDGLREIPIEDRGPSEITHIWGETETGQLGNVQVYAAGSPTLNPGFDVTPARLVTGIVTERGICSATEDGLLGLYPEQR